jgi:hypothetical protein
MLDKFSPVKIETGGIFVRELDIFFDWPPPLCLRDGEQTLVVKQPRR